ncbi:TPA: hypothetical protein MC769_003239 [Klebsiella aerogenes]|nr:hypothetical protein [Klebsiella aerogenes]
MKKFAILLCLMAGAANASSTLEQICTDYVKYLGHAFGYATSEDESMRKLLLADMKKLSLSEAMVQKEMYKATTDDAAKMYYSMFLNPDLNEDNRGAFEQMVTFCKSGPDLMIPSWAVLIAKGKVKKDDAGKSFMDTIRSDEFQNAPGMRHQKVEGSLMERARGPGKSPNEPIEYESYKGSNQISEKIKKCANEKFAIMKKDSPSVPTQNLMATAISLCQDGL